MSDVTTPRTLGLTDTGDLDTALGTLHVLAGLASVRQAVRIRLLTFLGEWFLDTTVGTALLQSILGQKNPSPVLLYGIFRDRILNTPGVKSVDALSLAFDRATRTLRVDFAATCDFGEFEDTVTQAA